MTKEKARRTLFYTWALDFNYPAEDQFRDTSFNYFFAKMMWSKFALKVRAFLQKNPDPIR